MPRYLLLLDVLPAPPAGTPAQVMQTYIDLLSTWLSRIGGLVAFFGAIKFALSIRSDGSKEQLTSIMTMVAGFMIQSAVKSMNIFNLPATYSNAAAEAEFKAILSFIGKWTGRVGALGLLIGAVIFGLAIRENNASSKIAGAQAMATGGIIVALAGILPTFV